MHCIDKMKYPPWMNLYFHIEQIILRQGHLCKPMLPRSFCLLDFQQQHMEHEDCGTAWWDQHVWDQLKSFIPFQLLSGMSEWAHMIAWVHVFKSTQLEIHTWFQSSQVLEFFFCIFGDWTRRWKTLHSLLLS